MRVAVVGTSGSGKTTLAKALATQLALPHIELDAVNWQAGWRDLSRTDPDEFVRRVALAIAAENMGGRWKLRRRSRPRLAAGDPLGLARLRAADHHVSGHPAFASPSGAGYRNVGGQPGEMAAYAAAEPSDAVGLSTWRRRRREYEERIGRSDYAHLVVLRLRQPRDAKKLLGQLEQDSGAQELSGLTGFRAAS